MTPSDAGGGHDMFDVWASIILPALGIVVAVAVPLFILYRQRSRDDVRIREERELASRQIAEERTLAQAEGTRERRRAATHRAVEQLAEFTGLNPFDVDMHPKLVRLRFTLIVLIDEYPADHPINDLVGNQHHYGMTIGDLILRSGPPKRRAGVSDSAYADAMVELIGPLSAWAAYFTSDLRVIQAGDVTEAQIRARADAVRAEMEQQRKRAGLQPAPSPTLRRPLRPFPDSGPPSPDRGSDSA
ncbi:hypothetical protein [Brachybacterium paraconglomeratum]|uniref:hypothetical protein n=1 Tax=Brachybacterium paraconglomeratum TaxID=173362 RepID=UPI0021A39920|nr:hypothetical protein [Brachybacterium paraconglomeratum]MCT1909662.1 hypothetical protein [Brachybacterium paraconglomeratum]